jgi:hypothetical protein
VGARSFTTSGGTVLMVPLWENAAVEREPEGPGDDGLRATAL